MALYLGSSGKLRLNSSNAIYRLIIPSSYPFVNGIILKSFDNYILKDSNGVYLTVKEDK
jgi:hypothetical protein